METNQLSKAVKSIINQRLLDAHTNYLAKIISIDINLVTVQPLNMVKVVGQKAQTAAIISDIPVLIPFKYVYTVDKLTNELLDMTQEKIEAGDILYCGVCDRDISEAKKGNIAAVSGRHHNLSDSIAIMGLPKVIYVEGEE